MDTRKILALRRAVLALLLAAGLGGCAVYGPPYGGYDSYPAYGYPTYVGPPVSLDLGFGFYGGHGHHHGGRGWHGGGHHRGGWGHGRGRR